MIKLRYEKADSQNNNPEEIDRAAQTALAFWSEKENQINGFEALPPSLGSWPARGLDICRKNNE